MGRDVVCVLIHKISGAVHSLMHFTTKTALLITTEDRKVVVQFDSTECNPIMATGKINKDGNCAEDKVKGEAGNIRTLGAPLRCHGLFCF